MPFHIGQKWQIQSSRSSVNTLINYPNTFEHRPDVTRKSPFHYTFTVYHCNKSMKHGFLPCILHRLVHDITPCEDVPDFEGMLSSCISEAPFGGRESTIAEESSTYNGPEVVVAHPSRENGQESPVDIKKPPERRRRKLPEIPKNCPSRPY